MKEEREREGWRERGKRRKKRKEEGREGKKRGREGKSHYKIWSPICIYQLLRSMEPGLECGFYT